MQEFGNVETPMYTRLRHFFGTIYNRCVCVFIVVVRFASCWWESSLALFCPLCAVC